MNNSVVIANTHSKLCLLLLATATGIGATPPETQADYQDFFVEDVPVVLSATGLEQPIFDARQL